MRQVQRTSLFTLVVLLSITACVLPNVRITDPVFEATMQALTIEAAILGTQRAAGPGTAAASPSASPTAPDTALPTQTATSTQTSVPSITPSVTLTATPMAVKSPTSLIPLISVSVPTNCRVGPGKVYGLAGALLVGEIAQVYARDPTSNYWYIANPDSGGDFCWVWGEYAVFSGNTSSLPIFTPPPTPTPTLTPTPVPSIEVSYEGLVWCTSTWWTEIGLENTSPLTFRSVEIILRDLELDVTETLEDDVFVNRPDCDTSTSKVSLQPDKTLVVSSPALDNNPEGHKMRATITLCTKIQQKGECVTEVLRFTP